MAGQSAVCTGRWYMLLQESLLSLLESIVPLPAAEAAVCLGTFSAGEERAFQDPLLLLLRL